MPRRWRSPNAAEPTVERTTLDILSLPSPASFSRVEVRRISIPPDLTVGAHMHNRPVLGVIESGSTHVQVDGGADRVLGPGETFYEPADTVITRFDPTDEGVVFVAWSLTPADVPPALTMS